MDFSTQKPQAIGANKKLKRNLRETDSEDEVESSFPRFIFIESKSSPITSLSPFIIKKVISSNITLFYLIFLPWETSYVEADFVFFYKFLFLQCFRPCYAVFLSQLSSQMIPSSCFCLHPRTECCLGCFYDVQSCSYCFVLSNYF